MKYKYWLDRCLSQTSLKRMLAMELQGAERVYRASEEQLMACGLNQDEYEKLVRGRQEIDPDEGLKYLQNQEIGIVTIEDREYPTLLKEVPDHPYALYYKGTFPTDFSHNIAIVGARKCSGYGSWAAEELAYRLANNGFTIVSGMAAGIDGASHYGALKAEGKTIAVLGCGVDVCYPASNRSLYNKIIEKGCVISEYLPGQAPLSTLFPQRNRIISALSQKVVVVEAKRKSGSLITADFALEQGKDLYAIPGRINDKLSEGTNQLLYQGALPLVSIDGFLDDIYELDDSAKRYERLHDTGKIHLEKAEALVYSSFDFYPVGLESIAVKSGLPIFEVIEAIDRLLELGLIRECFHNQYIRTQ